MSKNNYFKAPQKTLSSSWRDEVFNKPKTRGVVIVNKSRARNSSGTLVKVQGSYIASKQPRGSYQY